MQSVEKSFGFPLDFSHIIQQHWIRDTGPVSMETAKSQCAFFTLNSFQPSIDYDVKFCSTQPASQKFKCRNVVY